MFLNIQVLIIYIQIFNRGKNGKL
jgi:hypothetical protein